MRKKKNFIHRFWDRFISPTPQKYKRRAVSFGLLATTFATSFGAVKVLAIATPVYFDLFVGSIIFLCTAIATYSQQKAVPETPKAK